MDKKEPDRRSDVTLNTDQLRGKQSVRATFRLTDQMIDLLRIAAGHLGVKQKSLIDELIQDRENLEQVVRGAEEAEPKKKAKRQKTFVLSRNALNLLDNASKSHDVSRDFLVELCISRLIPIVNNEQEKHRKRRELLPEVERYLSAARSLLRKTESMLETDDRFRKKVEMSVTSIERDIEELRTLVKAKDTLVY